MMTCECSLPCLLSFAWSRAQVLQGEGALGSIGRRLDGDPAIFAKRCEYLRQPTTNMRYAAS
eukprot:scaffold2862_cov272-Pinguiococcus_pyrenoidosus.AAC.5